MKWEQIDQWHMKSGDWKISKAANVPYPYGLWLQAKNLGYWETLEAAISAAISEIACQA